MPVKRVGDRSPAFETLAIHAGQAPTPCTARSWSRSCSPPPSRSPSPASRCASTTRAAATRRARRSRRASRRSRAASAASRSAAAARPRPRCCTRCARAITWCAATTSTAARTASSPRCMQPLGIDTSFVDLRDPATLEAALTERTRMVWLEIADQPAAAAGRHRAPRPRSPAQRGVPLVVDNTFASPVLQRPARARRDRRPALDHEVHQRPLRRRRRRAGHCATPSWRERIALPAERHRRRAEPVRLLPGAARHQDAAAAHAAPRRDARPSWRGGWRAPRASRASTTPACRATRSTRSAQRQMRSGGGMISLELDGGLDAARRFLSALRLFALAESLGGVESLAEHPAIMTHASIPRDGARAARHHRRAGPAVGRARARGGPVGRPRARPARRTRA